MRFCNRAVVSFGQTFFIKIGVIAETKSAFVFTLVFLAIAGKTIYKTGVPKNTAIAHKSKNYFVILTSHAKCTKWFSAESKNPAIANVGTE